MRLFLFCVGGTGSRVLRPLAMLLASGVLPKDAEGKRIPLEVVPMVVDPHRANEDVKRTENILRHYRSIRHAVYGEQTDVKEGFFAAKISTLKDVVRNESGLSDSFLYNISAIESRRFRDLIAYNTLDTANQALCSLLFSNYQLDTKMDIGFVGSPNIGSVALNKIKDSEEFRQFSNVFQKDDRIFVISSIFGGTGAAGYPIIVNNIRDAAGNTGLNNRGDLRNARIGALTVLPYFNIQHDENSPISRADFISKTKSALFYYHDNVTGMRTDEDDMPTDAKVNACYYVGDEVPSTPYYNDPGAGGQRNDAHFVEFVGALSVFDFLSMPDAELLTVDGKARNAVFKEYGLSTDTQTVTLNDLGTATRRDIGKQWTKWHIAYMYVRQRLRHDIGRGYTLDRPEIRRDFLSTAFFSNLETHFFGAYEQWLTEMHYNRRSFTPFKLDATSPGDCVTGRERHGSLLRRSNDYRHVLAALNKTSMKYTFAKGEEPRKLLTLLNEALEKIVENEAE